MNQGSGPASPFLTLARWLQCRLPARLRGLITAGPDVLPETLPKGVRVRLVLPEDGLLWREIDLPELPADRRAAWIAARIDEVSPWAPGAYLWGEGAAEGGRLKVALAPLAPVAALRQRLEAGGRSLAEVVAGPLWLVEDRDRTTRLARALLVLWAGALVLALALGLWSWTWLSEAAAAAALAEERLARLAGTAAEGSDTARAARGLLAGKTPAASLATALDRLAAGLPLDSHLETLRLTPEGFEITGRSAAPEAIIPALEAGGFSGVDFAGASTRDATRGDYSFTLTGKIGGAP